MMNEHITAHILSEDNTIINTIVVTSLDDFPNLVDAAIGGTIGDKIVDGVLIPRPTEPEVQIVPQVVTRRQARQALLITKNSEGIPLLHLVEPAIAAIPDELQKGLAQIEWEDAAEFERNRELVVQIGAALGLNSTGLDELFIFATTL